MKRFIADMEQSPLFMVLLYQLNLCSIIYTANEYSIYRVCIMIKDFSIFFSTVTIVQDFETVTFYVLFVYKPTFSVIFVEWKGCAFQVSSIVFSSYTFP